MTDALDPEPLDPETAARVRSSLGAQAVMRELGVRITQLGAGSIELAFGHDERFTQQHGFLHAGILSTVLDSACGYAAFSLMPADAAVLTVEFKVNLLRPAQASRYVVAAHTIKSGRTLTVCHARATAADSDEEFAVMTATLMTLVGASIRH
jgi:uncharacterized protein (TIGR00369 family)